MFFNFGMLKDPDRKLKEFVSKIGYLINHRMITGNKMIIICELLLKEKQLSLNTEFDGVWRSLNSCFHGMP